MRTGLAAHGPGNSIPNNGPSRKWEKLGYFLHAECNPGRVGTGRVGPISLMGRQGRKRVGPFSVLFGKNVIRADAAIFNCSTMHPIIQFLGVSQQFSCILGFSWNRISIESVEWNTDQSDCWFPYSVWYSNTWVATIQAVGMPKYVNYLSYHRSTSNRLIWFVGTV